MMSNSRTTDPQANEASKKSVFSRIGRRRLILGATAIGAALGFTQVADARPFGRGHGPHGFGKGFVRMVERLDLTEEQELEAVRLRRALREEGRAFGEQTRADMKAVAAEMKSETPNREEIHKRLDQSSARMQQLAHSLADHVLDFHAKLEPAQKAELARLIEEREERMEKWRKRREDR